MNIDQAKSIVLSLAKGIDPVSGEVFAADSPYQHPEIIRALFIVLEQAVKAPAAKLSIEEKQAKNLAEGKPRNAGTPWTEELRAQLITGFHSQQSIAQLAQQLGRTQGSIIAELDKQGLINKHDYLPGRATSVT